MFGILKKNLNKFVAVFSKTIKLSEDDIKSMLDDLEIDLIQSDVGLEATDAFISNLKNELVGKEVEKDKKREFITSAIKKAMIDTIDVGEIKLLEFIKTHEKPTKIIFFGVNGTGKTTTIAKVAYYLKKCGLNSVVAAGDTFRAGAEEQIELHCQRVGVRVIKQRRGADAAAVIYDAVSHARAHHIPVVLADTAGRMQTNTNLMSEMKKIVDVNKPDLKIFVGDALTGNDAVEQARTFNENIGIDAIILTKMDADAKGGAAFSIVSEIKKPILFIGVGQTYDDLKPFDIEWFVNNVVGSGQDN